MRGRKPKSPQQAAKPIARVLPPPKGLPPDARAEWKRIVPELVARKVLTRDNLGVLSSYCLASGLVVAMERELRTVGHFYVTSKGDIRKHPAVAIQADAMRQQRQFASELSVTIASRHKGVAEEEDDTAELD